MREVRLGVFSSQAPSQTTSQNNERGFTDKSKLSIRIPSLLTASIELDP